MRAYIRDLETTVKSMHQDIKESYSVNNMKDVIADIMKEQITS